MQQYRIDRQSAPAVKAPASSLCGDQLVIRPLPPSKTSCRPGATAPGTWPAPPIDIPPGKIDPPVETGQQVRQEVPPAGEEPPVTQALATLGPMLASIFANIARQVDTVGNCALGPGLAFDQLGLQMPPAVATVQGQIVKNSGLFDQVPRSDVHPGDYGVRDWSLEVTKGKGGVDKGGVDKGGVDKGDALIATRVGPDGQLTGATDHTLAVPDDGGRYRNLTFTAQMPNF